MEKIINNEPLTKEETLKLLNGLIGLFSNEPKEVVYKEDYDKLNNKLNMIKTNIDTITKDEILDIIDNYTGFFGIKE